MMTISYAPLWETMKEKNISQYRLIHHHGLSAGQLYRLRKDMYVSTHTIEMLCNTLNCAVKDVMEMRQTT